MRTKSDNDELPASRVKCGRAKVVGLGLDDGEGHVRYTRGEDFELFGGSESSHSEMQRRARRISDEMSRLGISLDRMTYEQYQILQRIVDRVNCE